MRLAAAHGRFVSFDLNYRDMIWRNDFDACAGAVRRVLQYVDALKLSEEEVEGRDGYDLLEMVGRKRGFLVAGGEVNMRRTAETLLDEFRSGVIGRISLEKPTRDRRAENGGDAVC